MAQLVTVQCAKDDGAEQEGYERSLSFYTDGERLIGEVEIATSSPNRPDA
jgi:hypothetical protein